MRKRENLFYVCYGEQTSLKLNKQTNKKPELSDSSTIPILCTDAENLIAPHYHH